MSSVLIVDDSAAIRGAIRSQLEAVGVETVSEAVDGWEAIDKISRVNPDLVILDVRMLGLNGIDTAKELRRRRPKLPIILHTYHADAVRSVALRNCFTRIVAKGAPLMPVVLSLIQAGAEASSAVKV